ncbi:hypothetical protein L6452_40522 [Arctium lappa]|uniref:Uncharacterized protein n=1 Tax=Arctium lappa TaxID=4217 RepID=A0ACB8XMZ9_ARCLA|nr:hypothetical protein L6452_40522 [Arctium lappa]
MFIETSAKAGFNIKIVVALLGMETPSTKQENMVDNSFSQEVAKTNNDNSSMIMSDAENIIIDKQVDDEEKSNMDGRKHKSIVEVKGSYECDKRCEDMLKRMEDMLKRMEEIQEGMFRRSEEYKELVGDQSWYLLDPSELEP